MATPNDATKGRAFSSRHTTTVQNVRTVRILRIAMALAIFFLVHQKTGLGDHLLPPTVFSESNKTQWSRFAYVQYVTDTNYLCNSLMIFESLHRLGSKASRVMMYPSYMDKGDPSSAQLLAKARDEYKVQLQPINVQRREGLDSTWAESFTKLLAFNQTQYSRVLVLDSDATILQPMDELFLLPPATIALPHAYWLSQDDNPPNTPPTLSSQVMLIQPSAEEFSRVMSAVEEAHANEYDMEIINTLYRDTAVMLPHRPYNMISGELRRDTNDHASYLGSKEERWDAIAVWREVKYVHFSDWPLPKPWLEMDGALREVEQPKCASTSESGGDNKCIERELWNQLYDDFRVRREACGLRE